MTERQGRERKSSWRCRILSADKSSGAAQVSRKVDTVGMAPGIWLYAEWR
jgi:hypothetical protein